MSLAEVSAPHLGCDAADIAVSNYEVQVGGSRWHASCHGRRFLCGRTNTGRDSSEYSCAEMQAEQPQVVATGSPQSAGWQVREELAADGLRVVAIADAPSGKPVTLYLEFALSRETIETPAPGLYETIAPRRKKMEPPKYTNCHDLRLLADGELIGVSPPHYQAGENEERLYVIVQADALERMQSATRIAGAVCGTRWELVSTANLAVRNFLARTREELALRAPASQAASAGGEMPPSTAH